MYTNRDTVFIRGLQIDAVIGIYDHERTQPQPLLLDIELATDIRPAAASDDIALTLDYQAVCDRLQDFVGGSDFLLVETLAERCAALIMDEFKVPWMRLRLAKPEAISQASDVGVVIERGRRDADG